MTASQQASAGLRLLLAVTLTVGTGASSLMLPQALAATTTKPTTTKPAAKPTATKATAKPATATKPTTKPVVKVTPAVEKPTVAIVIPGSENMLLRKLPIHVDKLVPSYELMEKTQTADGTYNLILSNPNLLVHMEAIRQAYHKFGANPTEHAKFVRTLKARYEKASTNANYFFDYGYAQLVFDNNKNGLFFLRKANDSLVSPATNLAYGLAQVDADQYFENESPYLMTTRKMDVVYKLKDALTLNKSERMPGIWPTFVEIRQTLKPYDAYESMLKEDFSLMYVPKGSTELTARDFKLFTNPIVETPGQTTPGGKKPQFSDKKTPKRSDAKGTAVLTTTTPSVAAPAEAPVKKPLSLGGRFIRHFLGMSVPDEQPTPALSPVVTVNNLTEVVAVPDFMRQVAPMQADTALATDNTTLAMAPAEDNRPYGTPSQSTAEYGNVFLSMAEAAPAGGDNRPYTSSSPISSSALATTPMAAGAMAFPGSDTCSAPQPVDPKNMKFAVVMNLLTPQGPPNAVEFYNADVSAQPYYVRVLDISKHVIGQLYSSKAPFIMEDVDRDGVYELVVRQYQVDPTHPVFVYRWNGGCFVEDKQVASYFQ